MFYFTLALFPMCYILSLSLSYMLLLPWRLPPLSTFLLGVYTLSICPRSCAFLDLGTPHHDTVFATSAQYDLGICFSFIMARATSRMCRFLRSATQFCCGVCRQVNSHRIPSLRRYAVKLSEKYSLPPSNRKHRTCRPVAFSTSFLNVWKCLNTSLFCRII